MKRLLDERIAGCPTSDDRTRERAKPKVTVEMERP